MLGLSYGLHLLGLACSPHGHLLPITCVRVATLDTPGRPCSWCCTSTSSPRLIPCVQVAALLQKTCFAGRAPSLAPRRPRCCFSFALVRPYYADGGLLVPADCIHRLRADLRPTTQAPCRRAGACRPVRGSGPSPAALPPVARPVPGPANSARWPWLYRRWHLLWYSSLSHVAVCGPLVVSCFSRSRSGWLASDALLSQTSWAGWLHAWSLAPPLGIAAGPRPILVWTSPALGPVWLGLVFFRLAPWPSCPSRGPGLGIQWNALRPTKRPMLSSYLDTFGLGTSRPRSHSKCRC